MSSFGNYLTQTIRAVAFVTLASTLPAAAETVEVAPGVQVTKRTYTAPVNEQPFFGFAAKSAEQKAEDEKFVSAIDRRHRVARKGFRGNNQARLDSDTGRQGTGSRAPV